MCTIVVVSGRECENIGELTESLGGPPVLYDGYGEIKPYCCLCGVDIEATAAKYGMRASVVDGFDVYMEKP